MLSMYHNFANRKTFLKGQEYYSMSGKAKLILLNYTYITWTSIQIKMKALIVHASVSVLLLYCTPFWYTDVWTLLNAHTFSSPVSKEIFLPWFFKTFYQTRKAVSSRWKEGANASRGECVQFPTELLPGAWPCVQLPPRARADPARLR